MHNNELPWACVYEGPWHESEDEHKEGNKEFVFCFFCDVLNCTHMVIALISRLRTTIPDFEEVLPTSCAAAALLSLLLIEHALIET